MPMISSVEQSLFEYCYCDFCDWSQESNNDCYCCWDNVCRWYQVSSNHYLSADHFPEVTSSNTPYSQYQYDEEEDALNIKPKLMLFCGTCMLLVIEVGERSNWKKKITLINFLFEIQTSFHWWKVDTEHSNFSIFHSSKLIILFAQIIPFNKAVQVQKKTKHYLKKSSLTISLLHVQHDCHNKCKM